VWRVRDEGEARARIVSLVEESDAHEVVCAAAPDLAGLVDVLAGSGVDVCVAGETTDSIADLRVRSAAAQVGIGPADYAIAESGTIVIVHGPAHPRCVSLLPPVHIAWLRTGALVADLHELFEKMQRDGCTDGSAITFVTGPSRTADIEMILTLGVHGPGVVHLVLIDA
jgi:L-lactate dehydrogenase complex protein LldG